MKNMIYAALNLLLALSISSIPLKAQTFCNPDQTTHVTGLKRLAYGSPVDLTLKAARLFASPVIVGATL